MGLKSIDLSGLSAEQVRDMAAGSVGVNLEGVTVPAKAPKPPRDPVSTLTRWQVELRVWCANAGLPEPAFEVRWHNERLWRFDAAWPALRVACELDGLPRTGERAYSHCSRDGMAGDHEKLNEAALAGWLVVRFTSRQWASGKAFGWLERALRPAAGGRP